MRQNYTMNFHRPQLKEMAWDRTRDWSICSVILGLGSLGEFEEARLAWLAAPNGIGGEPGYLCNM